MASLRSSARTGTASLRVPCVLSHSQVEGTRTQRRNVHGKHVASGPLSLRAPPPRRRAARRDHDGDSQLATLRNGNVELWPVVATGSADVLDLAHGQKRLVVQQAPKHNMLVVQPLALSTRDEELPSSEHSATVSNVAVAQHPCVLACSVLRHT